MTTPDELRAEAASVLRPLCDLAAPVRPGSDVPWDQLVRIGEHTVHRAADCPASVAHDGEFDGWRAAFARKRLGLIVLNRLRRPGAPPPQTCAAQAIDDLAAEGRDTFSQWLAQLGPGGRAAVAREAVGFAVAARLTLDQHGAWRPDDRSTRFVTVPFHWGVPGRAVRLEAQVECQVVRGPARYLLLLDHGGSGPAAMRRSVAHTALVSTLATGVRPTHVTHLDLDTGARRQVPVTDDVLDDGLTAAAAATAAAMSARYAEPARPVPGGWCRTCRGRHVCPVAA